MKEIIQKWLGITEILELKKDIKNLAKAETLTQLNNEWEVLRKELEKAQQTDGGMVRLMITSGTYYKDKIQRFIELSTKLEKWK